MSSPLHPPQFKCFRPCSSSAAGRSARTLWLAYAALSHFVLMQSAWLMAQEAGSNPEDAVITAATTLGEVKGQLVALEVESNSSGNVSGQLAVQGEMKQTLDVETLQTVSWFVAPPAETAVVPPTESMLIVGPHGLQLSAKQLGSTGVKGDTLELTLLGETTPRQLPLAAVSGFALPASAEDRQAWEAARGENLEEDRLLLRKGATVDSLDGVFVELKQDQLLFRPTGIEETVALPRARVVGVWLRSQPASAKEIMPLRLVLARGDQVPVSRVRWNVATSTLSVQVATTAAQEGVSWDFSRQALDRLEFLGQQGIPLASLATESKQIGLALLQPKLIFTEQLGQAVNGNKSTPAVGQPPLVLPGYSQWSYRLGGRYRSLIASVQLAAGSVVPVRMEVRGNDQVLWEQTLEAGEPPRELSLNLAGVDRLTITVDGVAFRDMCGSLLLEGAKVVP